MTLHRLSGFDAALLALESPTQMMHQCSLAELDVSGMSDDYSFDAFRDILRARTNGLPEFRARLADSQLNLDTPVWVEDVEFDIDNHVHRIDVPAPGGRAELSAIASRLAAQPLDRNRPLWDIWVIEGVGETSPQVTGRVAAVVRTHHVFADGVTSGDLWAQLHAAHTDAPPPDHVEGFGHASSGRIAVDGLAQFARRPWFLLTTVLPATVAGALRTVARRARGQTMSRPFGAPRTPFNGDVSVRRSVAYSRLDLDAVKIVKNKYGVKVNDVLLAVISGALRQFLLARGTLPESGLVAMMPVSVYDSSRTSRNQMAAVFSHLHTHIPDPGRRINAIAQDSSAAKDHLNNAIGTTLLQDWAQVAPGVLAAIMWLYRRSGLTKRRPAYNVSLSNVQSTQDKILGAPIISNYPFGPVVDGVGLNITAASLNGNVDIGIVSCPDLLPDLWDLADYLESALKELIDAPQP
ncbi:WS/DGAT/MGAT family O-acyltransferase [Mycobacterium syngnathidarum]